VGVEKPVADKVEAIERCYDVCSRHGVQLYCSFQRRFDPSYQILKAKCADLGPIANIHTIFRDHPMPPIEFLKTGGDPFHDLMVHDIDYIRWITNDEPEQIFALGTSFDDELRERGIFDFATIMLRMRSGTSVTMELSRHSAYGYDQRCEVFGSNGCKAAVQNPRESEWEWSGPGGSQTGVLEFSFPERFRSAFEHEMLHFADVIHGSVEPIVTKRDSLAATTIAEAARISATTGSVVHITNQHQKTPKIEEGHFSLVSADSA